VEETGENCQSSLMAQVKEKLIFLHKVGGCMPCHGS